MVRGYAVGWRRGPGRAADDEPRLAAGDAPVDALSLLDLGEQQPNRLGALLADRLVDRRQRRVDVGGKVDVVEADDAEVAGNRRPSSRAARMAPIAIASLIARTAVGRMPAAQARWNAAAPPSIEARPATTVLGGRGSTPAASSAAR